MANPVLETIFVKPGGRKSGLGTQLAKLPEIIDIIAIHGLNGHYARIWTEKAPSGGSVNWLKDFLPEFIPEARILSYSYNSSLQCSKSHAGIDDFAEQLLEDPMSWRTSPAEKEKPVIFICHSLARLVFKHVVVSSQ